MNLKSDSLKTLTNKDVNSKGTGKNAGVSIKTIEDRSKSSNNLSFGENKSENSKKRIKLDFA